MSCTGTSDCLCGCCSGISVQTPQGENNLPGLPAIAYRTGTWATFKESMLARLSSAEYPALAGLKTRDNDDFSIALLDASSVILDILTFYQERLANESYLRTARQLQSLTELSRLIGYQPAPGVGSAVYLSFSLSSAPGSPTDPTTQAITIAKGTQVQSVPAQGQTPQTFETSSDILAKADWNALPVQTGIPWMPQTGDVNVYLQGTATQLQPGDAILIVGDERRQPGHSSDPHWDLRIVTAVQTDTTKNVTYVKWGEGLGDAAAGVPPASSNPKFYALRQRAALFGYNSVNPLMLTPRIRGQIAALLNGNEWKFGISSDRSNLVTENLVDLDSVYSKLAVGGWLALIVPDMNTSRSPSGFVSLCLIESITTISRSDYAMSAKISRVATDSQPNLSTYYQGTRHTSVLTQSEELAVTERPLTYPLYGSLLDLKGVRVDLAGVQAIAVYGKSQKLQVNAGVNPSTFVPDDDSGNLTLKPGDLLTILEPVNLPLARLDPRLDNVVRCPQPARARSQRARGNALLAAEQLHPRTRLEQRSCPSGICFDVVDFVGKGPVSTHAHSSCIGTSQLLRPHRDHRQRECRTGDPGHVGQRDSRQRIGFNTKPEVLSQAKTADLRASADSDRAPEHAGSDRQWRRVD